jgi:hypothetical protein
MGERGLRGGDRLCVLLLAAEDGSHAPRRFGFNKDWLGRRPDRSRRRDWLAVLGLESRVLDLLAEAFQIDVVVDVERGRQDVVDVGQLQGEFAVEALDLSFLRRDVQ